MLKSDLSFEELISACKTKNLTWSKISRNLLHIMLDITKEKVEKARTYDMSPYFSDSRFQTFCFLPDREYQKKIFHPYGPPSACYE